MSSSRAPGTGRRALHAVAPPAKKADQAQRRRRHTSERQHLRRRHDQAPTSGSSMLRSALAPVAFLRDFVPSSQSDFEQRLLAELGVDVTSDDDDDNSSSSGSSETVATQTVVAAPNRPTTKPAK